MIVNFSLVMTFTMMRSKFSTERYPGKFHTSWLKWQVIVICRYELLFLLQAEWGKSAGRAGPVPCSEWDFMNLWILSFFQ